MLAKLGAARVVPTDIDPHCITLCVANARRNGFTATAPAQKRRSAPWHKLFQQPSPAVAPPPADATARVVARLLPWGGAGDHDLSDVVDAAGGSCPLVVAADVLYDRTPAVHAALEHTLRGLILRGGCKRIVMSWMVSCASLLCHSTHKRRIAAQ